jgi:branched-chain amino acid aminotransferase
MNYCDESIHQPFVSPHKTSRRGRCFVIFHQNQKSRQLKLDLIEGEAFTPADFPHMPGCARTAFLIRQCIRTKRRSVFTERKRSRQETIMSVDTAPRSTTWTYVDGQWLPGNPPLIGPTSHAMWLASTVFDGARWFDGVAPDLDLHCQRVNRSAVNMGMKPTMTAEEIEALALEGVKKFDGKMAIYIKPMYWAEHGMPGSVVAPDASSTRFALCLFEAPMDAGKPLTLTVSPLRRPSPETAMTDAKAGSLYPNSGRAILEARSRGFDNALMRDMNGNVAESASANIFMVKDGVVLTPVPNRTFLAGITRSRVIGLLRQAGFDVREATLSVEDFREADEIFCSGNYSKVSPVVKLDDRELQAGPVARKALDLYMEWARLGADV